MARVFPIVGESSGAVWRPHFPDEGFQRVAGVGGSDGHGVWVGGSPKSKIHHGDTENKEEMGARAARVGRAHVTRSGSRPRGQRVAPIKGLRINSRGVTRHSALRAPCRATIPPSAGADCLLRPYSSAVPCGSRLVPHS